MLVYAYAIEPYWFEVTDVTLTSSDIPASFYGKRIVFIADVHHGPFFSREQVADVVGRVNNLEPDVIILGGDYVHKSRQYIKPCFEELEKLDAPLGIYGVLGNHDHWEDADESRQEMENAGITAIDNTAVWISSGGERIRVGGVGDLWTDDPDIEATTNESTVSDYVILVSHNPDYAEDIRTDEIDIVLSGHTHGGQVTFFDLWAPASVTEYGKK